MHDTKSVQARVASPLVALFIAGALTGILWLVMAVLGAGPASAVPARAVTTRFTQPDGSTFSARLYGDEWSNGYETRSGYTVVKSKKSGFWEYAVRRDGRLAASGLRVGKAEPTGISRHVRERLRGHAAAASKSHSVFANDAVNVGSQPSIVLLVDYANQVGSTTEAAWATKFFGASGSVNDYYDEVTYNQLDLPAAAESFGTANNGVVGWLRLSGNHPDNEGQIDVRNRTITRNAILASDPFVDYASFDTNANGSISTDELHITVIVAGHETSYGGPGQSCGNSVWGHNWTLFGTEIPTVDGKQVANANTGGGYNQFGEKHCWSGDPTDDHIASIGIMVHEMGHDLNLPDLYDTDGSSYGIGEWSVMAGGSWTTVGANPAGSSPVHPDAFSKWYEGWLTPTEISGNQAGVQLTEMSSTGDVAQLLDNPNGLDWTFQETSGTGQYFLVENRQLSGYDAGLPGCGVLIWHIDETRSSDNDANANEARKLVDLEESDGLSHLDNGVNPGDTGDPYRGPRVFNATSNPNSNLYGGAASGVSVNNISSTCSATMTADMSTTTTTPDPTTTTLSISKTRSNVKGSGQVQPAHPGLQVSVSLYKRRASGTWRKIATKTDTLNSSSRYAKSFNRPSSGRCKMTTKFASDGDHLGSKVTKQFRC